VGHPQIPVDSRPDPGTSLVSSRTGSAAQAGESTRSCGDYPGSVDFRVLPSRLASMGFSEGMNMKYEDRDPFGMYETRKDGIAGPDARRGPGPEIMGADEPARA
jgi:Fe2+ transport system protein FeoA